MRDVRTRVTIAIIAAVLTTGLAAQQDRPPVYPTTGDPEAAITSALADAARDGKHVLLDFGADWCPDCRVLDIRFDDPQVAPYLDAHYHVVRIDIGRRDRNEAIVKKYRATSGDWIPALVVLDARGAIIGRTDATVRVSRQTTPGELLAVLERWAPKRQVASLGVHQQHGVRVTVTLDTDHLGRRHWIAATYAPVDPGVHLYGASLPARGIDGLGRPTVLRVANSPRWTVAGDVVADRIESLDRIDALGVSIPVYPPGPVTLRVPIRLAPHRGSVEDRVTIGYMGCSDVGCLPPVTNRQVTVRLPGTDRRPHDEVMRPARGTHE